MLPLISSLAGLVLALSPQATDAAPSTRSESAPAAVSALARRTLFHNGRIYLNDGRGTVVEALLVENGRVLAAGPRSELAQLAGSAGWRSVDLRGTTAVPGLQDAHGHLELYSELLEAVDLGHCASYEELIEALKQRASELPEGNWILGRGWDQSDWSDPIFPHHEALSEALPAHPVFLTHLDGHAALVNRAALKIAKLDEILDGEQLPKSTSGKVFLDEEGFATGVLLEGAMELVRSVVPQPDESQRYARLMRAQQQLLGLGLTCVHDMGVSPDFIELLEKARERDELRLRVVAYLDGDGELSEESLEGYPRLPDAEGRLSVEGVKLRADGILASHGAALLDDYHDAPGERGQLAHSENELGRRILTAVRAGMQPAVHAVGDRANRLVLDIFDSLSKALPEFVALRPRIEHASVVATKDWPRFPACGVVPSMQPVQALTDTDRALERLGPERAGGTHAWRRLAPGLGQLAFGSDFPIQLPNPLLGIFAARTGGAPAGGDDLPEKSLDGAAALAGYTSGAAYACHQENRRGSLKPGYWADLTVLSVDPVLCDPEQLLEAEVLMTVINGEIAFRHAAR